MGAVLRLLPPLDTEHHRSESRAVEDRARSVIEDLQRRGHWKRPPALEDAAALRETLQVVGDYDLELLVQIAADAIETAAGTG
jgi:hypothetical protein